MLSVLSYLIQKIAEAHLQSMTTPRDSEKLDPGSRTLSGIQRLVTSVTPNVLGKKANYGQRHMISDPKQPHA